MTKQDLLSFSDIAKLYQYLALGQTIEFNNGLANIVLSMDSNFNVNYRSLDYPEVPEQSYNDMLFPSQLLGIIDILKNTQSEDGDTKWNKINTYVAATVCLNMHNLRR